MKRTLNIECVTTRTHEWVELLKQNQNNELLTSVGENFDFLLSHTDEFETGDIEYTDLPELSRGDKWIQFTSVIFGTRWPPATPELYPVMNQKTNELVELQENGVLRAVKDLLDPINGWQSFK